VGMQMLTRNVSPSWYALNNTQNLGTSILYHAQHPATDLTALSNATATNGLTHDRFGVHDAVGKVQCAPHQRRHARAPKHMPSGWLVEGETSIGDSSVAMCICKAIIMGGTREAVFPDAQAQEHAAKHQTQSRRKEGGGGAKLHLTQSFACWVTLLRCEGCRAQVIAARARSEQASIAA